MGDISGEVGCGGVLGASMVLVEVLTGLEGLLFEISLLGRQLKLMINDNPIRITSFKYSRIVKGFITYLLIIDIKP